MAEKNPTDWELHLLKTSFINNSKKFQHLILSLLTATINVTVDLNNAVVLILINNMF